MKFKSVAFLAGGLAVLVSAVVSQSAGWRNHPVQSKGPHLAASLPAQLGAVIAVDLPLGPSEGGDELVKKVLQCDDVLFRSYTTISGSFEVYVAYWGANKIPSQMVASHTPDRCWTDNGWRCIAMKFNRDYSWGTTALKPAQWRKFSFQSSQMESVNVLYWHVVGDQPYVYGNSFNRVPNPFRYWGDFAHYLVSGAGEQYFVRISSRESFEKLWTDPGFQEVLEKLSCLALAESTSS